MIALPFAAEVAAKLGFLGLSLSGSEILAPPEQVGELRASKKPKGSICLYWGLPKIICSLVGVPIRRILAFLGLSWGP